MPFELNEKLRNLTPYDPIMGYYPIRLDANESYLPIESQERNAIARAVKHVDLRRYPDPEAAKLCQSAAAYYGTKPTLLTAWNGTDEAILLLCNAFLGKGNTLLSFALDFSMYHFNAYLTGAHCIKLPKTADFKIDVDALIAALQAYKPTMLLFSNPCNPTSLLLPAGDVTRIVAAGEEHGTLVVVDEAYMDFCDQSLLGEVERFSNLVILRTCSKAIGLAGLRLGFTAANPTLTRVLRSVKSPYNLNAITQAVGEQIFRQPLRLQEHARQIRKSTDTLSRALQGLGMQVAGDAANFIFLKNSAGAFEFLKARGIITRKFGAHLRITSGTQDENVALLCNMKKYLADPML